MTNKINPYYFPPRIEEEAEKDIESYAGKIVSFIGESIVCISKLPIWRFDPESELDEQKRRVVCFSGGQQAFCACQLVAEYIKQYISHHFTYPPELNRVSPDWVTDYARSSDGKVSFFGVGIYKTLKEREERVTVSLQACVTKAVANLLERFSGLTMDTNSPLYSKYFFLDLFTDCIHDVTEHLHLSNQAIADIGINKPSNVLMSYFEGELHRGLTPDCRGNEVHKRGHAVNNFFYLIGKQLLSVIYPEGDVVVPYRFKASTMQSLKNTVIPNMLYDVVESVCNKETINLFLLYIISLVKEEEGQSKKIGPFQEWEDQRQKELEKKCTRGLSEAIQFFFPTMAKPLQHTPSILQRVGFRLARDIRCWTEEQDPQSFVNETIEKALPYLHQGKWKTHKKQRIFFPKIEGRKTVEFSFPKNKSEAKEIQKKQKIYREKLQAQATASVADLIAKTIFSLPENVVNAISQPAVSLKNMVIQEAESPVLLQLIKVIELVAKGVFSLTVWIAYIVSLPLKKPVQFIVKRYANWKAKDMIRRFHLDIHRNMAYRVFETFIKHLELNKTYETKYEMQ